MARPAARSRCRPPRTRASDYDLSSLFLLASTAALFSTSIKEKLLELLPEPDHHRLDRFVGDGLRWHQHRRQGRAPHAAARGVTIDHRTVVLDDDGNEVKPGSGVRGVIAKKGNIPVGYYKDEKKTAETFQTYNGVRLRDPRRLRGGRGGRHRHDARPWLGVDQQRRREDLP